MKKLCSSLFSLLFICAVMAQYPQSAVKTASGYGQPKAAGTVKKYKKKGYHYNLTGKYNPNDSALVYYNKGWDYFKMDSLGPARYYWDLAGNYPSNSPSKFAALHRLGMMQENGQGVDTNLQMALDYYKRAANYEKNGIGGNPDAVKSIGTFYENGYLFEKDDNKALFWYQRAKMAGNKYCDEDIKRCVEKIRKAKMGR